MKKLILLLLFIPLVSFGQKLNKDSNGYTEVIEVELSKKDIHQKINEWVGLNYKSAQDVIQLNTEDKVIVKGNFKIPLKIQTYLFEYRVNTTLTFSLKENKYKVDLNPTDVTHISGGYDAGLLLVREYLFPNTLTKDEYLNVATVNAKEGFIKLGYSEAKAIKSAEKIVKPKRLERSFNNHKENKIVWDNTISSFYESIKNYIAKSENDEDDDW